MEKTYSEKVARFFEICGYILILPGLFCIGYPLFLFLNLYSEPRHAPPYDAGPANHAFNILLILIWVLIFVFGAILQIGYFRHSRANLDDRMVVYLWVSTSLFNFPLLVISGLYLLVVISDVMSRDSFDRLRPLIVFLGLFTAYYLAAFFLPISALVSNRIDDA